MRYYTVAEVAELLRVRKETVYGWIKRGEIASIQFARTLRIESSDLEQFVQCHRNERRTNA